MRKYRDTPAPQEIAQQQRNDTIKQVRTYSLITPMFGGGVEPARLDEVTVIRGSEIRGQLRFWWRACRGGQFGGDCEKMKQVENFIWGKAYKKGDKTEEHQDIVQIAVEATNSKKVKHLYPFGMPQRNPERQHQPTYDVPQYAAFPLREKKQAVFDGISFTLTITFPREKRLEEEVVIQVANEVKAALWAWETFGGIGARTRRGFGALRCESVKEGDDIKSPDLPLAEPAQTLEWLQKKLECYVGQATAWPPDVTHLPVSFVERETCRIVRGNNGANDPTSLWKILVDKLGRFRQMGRISAGKKVPGRSLWPEPDTIRYLTNQSLKRKDRQPVLQPPIDKFPRAAFGLPIIFHFKDNKDNDRRPDSCNPFGDPRQTVLQEKGFERLASPLILKPLACQSGNSIGLAVILACARSKPLQLELKTQQGREGSWEVQAALDEDEELPLQEQNGGFRKLITSNTDLLQIFLQYL